MVVYAYSSNTGEVEAGGSRPSLALWDHAFNIKRMGKEHK